MLSVVKNALECFELHLRGSNNFKFPGSRLQTPQVMRHSCSSNIQPEKVAKRT